MKIKKHSRLNYKFQHILFVVLLLSCIGFAGWLSNEYNIRSDWTAGKRHSLSNDTLQLLQQLPSPIKIRSYQPDNPTLTSAVTEILKRYQDNKNDVNFQLFNPDIFIEQAKADNIERYGQTIIEYQGQTERIDILSEEAISNALMRLHRGDKPSLLFISQHGERDINDESAIGYTQLTSRLTNKGFNVKKINLLQQSLEIENTVLVISSINKPLLASELEKIQQFIKNGGNILWLQDPGIDSSQTELLNNLKINFIDGVMVENNQEVSSMLKLSHPAFIPILEYKLHPITKKMQYYTLFTTATAIQKQTESDWNYTDLLISSKDSWSEFGNFILGVEFNAETDIPGPLSIGIAQSRQAASGTTPNTQRVVIIGDTDFIANNNLGNGANLDFIINIFNWLSKDDKLISIAPKNAPDMKLDLSASKAATIGFVFLIVLPLILFSFGGFIWLKRHKQ